MENAKALSTPVTNKVRIPVLTITWLAGVPLCLPHKLRVFSPVMVDFCLRDFIAFLTENFVHALMQLPAV